MVKVREYKDTDFEEVTRMYHDLLKTVYPKHTVKPIQYCYRNILVWISLKYDITVTENDKEITGFGLAYADNMGGAVEEFYQGEIVYVKPEFRKGRSAYLIYSSYINYAKSQKMLILTNASNITESSHISKKLGTELFTTYQRECDEE